MKKYIIIRAGVNGGKTTTSGILFEHLRKQADFSKLFTSAFKEIENLRFSENGSLIDFIGILIVKGKVIIIISQGDVSSDLENILNKLDSEEFIKMLTDGLNTVVNIVVCCARSQFRKNSTIEMLTKRVNKEDRYEFWTKRSENLEEKLSLKEQVIKSILEKIETL